MSQLVHEQVQSQDVGRRGPRVPPFGNTVDPREAGRKGGLANAANRKLRAQRQLEDKVLEARNGAAAVKLLEIRMRREEALEAERLGLDQVVRHLTERKEILEEQVDEMSERLSELDDQVTALEQRRQAAQSIDDDALVELLRGVGELRVQRACIACGFVDDEDVDAVA